MEETRVMEATRVMEETRVLVEQHRHSTRYLQTFNTFVLSAPLNRQDTNGNQ